MNRLPFVILILLFSISACKNDPTALNKEHTRGLQDTIGFAQYAWQMDSIYKRLKIEDTPNNFNWKAAICPHDDYKYAGALYYKSLQGINANTIIMIGVAHKARNFDLKDKLVFGDFNYWKSPYGQLPVSGLNGEILKNMDNSSYVLHDDMQALEHSLEAIVPFLNKKNPDVEIIPILVPYINYSDLDRISTELARAVHKVMLEHNLAYGKDLAIVISNDAVHYGDTDWGGKNMAPYGVDSPGTLKARTHDKMLIEKYLSGTLDMHKIQSFLFDTTYEDNYQEYKWVWCGRYSVPFGLATANKLNLLINKLPLSGTELAYSSSIDHKLIAVEDIRMGTTAIATQNHWVAYTSIKYE